MERSRFEGADVGDGQENTDSQENTDTTDSDSDSDDVEITVKPIDASQFKQIPEEERSTHFIAIKITEPDIVENAVQIQQHIVSQEEVKTFETLKTTYSGDLNSKLVQYSHGSK